MWIFWKLLFWVGAISEKSLIKCEVKKLNKEIYEAEIQLHDAQYTRDWLKQRRDFLISQYGFAVIPDRPSKLPGTTTRFPADSVFVAAGSHSGIGALVVSSFDKKSRQ